VERNLPRLHLHLPTSQHEVNWVTGASTGSTTPGASRNALGWRSPIEYEEKHYTNQATTEQANLKPRQPIPAS
jgi:hypothetical protein